jgi:hypothetical protein
MANTTAKSKLNAHQPQRLNMAAKKPVVAAEDFWLFGYG